MFFHFDNKLIQHQNIYFTDVKYETRSSMELCNTLKLSRDILFQFLNSFIKENLLQLLHRMFKLEI